MNRYYWFERKVAAHLDPKMSPLFVESIAKDPDSGRYYSTSFEKDNTAAQTFFYAATVLLACRPGKMGQYNDPLGSASDPFFFPLHVNWERQWSYMRMAKNLSSYWSNSEAF